MAAQCPSIRFVLTPVIGSRYSSAWFTRRWKNPRSPSPLYPLHESDQISAWGTTIPKIIASNVWAERSSQACTAMRFVAVSTAPKNHFWGRASAAPSVVFGAVEQAFVNLHDQCPPGPELVQFRIPTIGSLCQLSEKAVILYDGCTANPNLRNRRPNLPPINPVPLVHSWR